MNFKERLQFAMQFRGVNQLQLAVKSQISRSSICLYLKGERIPKTEQIYRLALALEVSPSYLFGESDQLVIPIINYGGMEDFSGTKTIKRTLLDEIMSACSNLDIETLKTVREMVKALVK